MVNLNANLTDIQKLYCLKNCLKGKAEQIINSLVLTEENYNVALELIKEGYDNKCVIVLTRAGPPPPSPREGITGPEDPARAGRAPRRMLGESGPAFPLWETLARPRLDGGRKRLRDWSRRSFRSREKSGLRRRKGRRRGLVSNGTG
jgi:hypothetical protein